MVIEQETIAIEFITNKKLLFELPYSKIYEVEIGGEKYIYKVIRKNPKVDFNKVKQSYENLENLKDLDFLVKIYDYGIVGEGSHFEILMEYLNDYYHLSELPEDKRGEAVSKTLQYLDKIFERGFVPLDNGIENTLTNGTDIKIIDLDFLLKWNQVTNFNISWFSKKLEDFIKWHPVSEFTVRDFIKKFHNYRNTHSDEIMIYNQVLKLNNEAEKLMNEENKFEEAIELLNQALDYDQYYHKLYNNLGICYWKLEDFHFAIELFKQATKFSPNNRECVKNYIQTLFTVNLKEHAISAAFNFINNNPADNELWEFISKLGESDKSKDYIQYTILQNLVDSYTYPVNYAYDVRNFSPKGELKIRVDYFNKYTPEIFNKANKVLSIGSSLSYVLLSHAKNANKCIGVEPDIKAIEIVKRILKYHNISNVQHHNTTFKHFSTEDKFDLIWMGNVFHYMYADFGWMVAEKLAELSTDKCIIEAPLEGEFLVAQSHLNSLWKNKELMDQYTLENFRINMSKYFDIVSISPSGTDPENRLLVSLKRKK